jgi:hypothetical protein
MVKIVSLAEWFIAHARNSGKRSCHDRNPVQETETDRLIATLNTLIRETPMADDEKLVVVLLASIDERRSASSL